MIATDRTYRVLALARYVADGRHAEDIATEDILHGLAMEGYGVAANVLRELGVQLDDPAPRKLLADAARIHAGSLRGEAAEFWQRAEAEARECHRRLPASVWLGTEHLLLAMTTGGNETGTRLLCDKLAPLRLSLPDVRTAVLTLFGLPS